jgi:hypothetical protein
MIQYNHGTHTYMYKPATTRPPGYSIQKINHRHEQIINWLLANPHRTLKECAAEFGYTKEWIYALVGTDLFQAEYQRRAREAAVPAIHTVRTRIAGLALLALEKAEEKLASGRASDTFHSSSMRTALEALGFIGQNGQPSLHRHEHIHIDGEALLKARESARLSGVSPAKGDNVIEPEPEKHRLESGILECSTRGGSQ